MREGEEAVAAVQEQYEAGLADVERLVKERQRWQEAWDEQRERMEADKAAFAASMEVSPQYLQFPSYHYRLLRLCTP